MVSGMPLIEATDNPRTVHNLCRQTQHPKQDHHLESPRTRPEPLPALSFNASQQVVQKQEEKSHSARLYPSLECFCTVVGSSSSSSCFSQQKHSKPARRSAGTAKVRGSSCKTYFLWVKNRSDMISFPAILTSQIPLAESLSGKITLTS